MKELIKAIYSKNAGSALDALINGQIYYGSAPPGTRYPYVVFFNVTDLDHLTFTDQFTDFTIQFSAFSALSRDATEIIDIKAAIKALYNEQTLSITGSTLVWFNFENAVGPDKDDSITQDGADGGWSCHLDFDVKTSLN